MAKTPPAAASKSAQKSVKKPAGPHKTEASAVSALPRYGGPRQKTLERTPPKKIPGSFRLFGATLALIRHNWLVLLGIAAIYTLLNLLLIQGLNTDANLTSVKRALDLLPTNGAGQVANGFSLYSRLLGASGSSLGPTAGVYQFVIIIVVSLAIIWALRQIFAGAEVRIRDSFYRGMYPLVTFLLVGLMVLAQLLPLAVGAAIYSVVLNNGIAASTGEQVLFLLGFLGLAVLSLYLLCSSLFALLIVTLPDMTPMAALRSARDLVAHRRWTIMRRIVFLPIALLVLSAVLVVPVALFATVLATWIFTALSAVLLLIGITYMYNLYRALL